MEVAEGLDLVGKRVMLSFYALATRCPILASVWCYALSGTGTAPRRMVLAGERDVRSPICLRACYAVSGTFVAFGAMSLRACYAVSGTGVAFGAMNLRACYAVSGNGAAYGATKSGIVRHVRYWHGVWCCRYAMFGTRSAVLTQRMLLPGSSPSDDRSRRKGMLLRILRIRFTTAGTDGRSGARDTLRVSSTDFTGHATGVRSAAHRWQHPRCPRPGPTLSAYARAMRCPVLRERMPPPVRRSRGEVPRGATSLRNGTDIALFCYQPASLLCAVRRSCYLRYLRYLRYLPTLTTLPAVSGSDLATYGTYGINAYATYSV
eukprot:3722609-Rhodomonas_salina.1